MNTHQDSNPFDEDAFVYIRLMDAAEISEVLPQNEIGELRHPDQIFAVLSSDGERLAIVEGRDAAYAAAVAHDLKPLSVH
ncbi:MAG: DUF1150 family protein [Hyphomonas sp.]